MTNQLFRNVANQRRGKSFEQVFLHRAAAQGLFVIHNGQKVRWLPGGKVMVERCQLDFTLLSAGGRLAALDCKQVKGSRMAFSAFDPRQVQLAKAYADHGFRAGFVVHFEEPRLVSFFSAADVSAIGPRQSAKPSESNVLGSSLNFDLTRLLRPASTR